MTSLSTSTPSQSKMMRSKFTKTGSRKSGFLFVERNAVQLQPVIDQLVAELAGDLGLQFLDFLGSEFNLLAVAQVDQMIVVAVGHLLIARPALAKIVPLDDSGVLEQFYGAVHRRDRDLVVDRYTAPVEFLDVRMVDRISQHARDHPALFGHAHAGGGAAGLDTGILVRRRGFQYGHGLRAFRRRSGVFCHRPHITTSHAASEVRSVARRRVADNSVPGGRRPQIRPIHTGAAPAGYFLRPPGISCERRGRRDDRDASATGCEKGHGRDGSHRWRSTTAPPRRRPYATP